MSSTSSTSGVLLIGIILSAVVGQSAVGQGVQLEDVPDTLYLPIHDGANRIMTASIGDLKAKAVWLGPSAGTALPKERVPLVAVGEGRYQINLAERAVYELLREHGPAGEFRVYVETIDGAVVPSVTVRYVVHGLPKRLDLESDEVRFTVSQRSWTALPGSSQMVYLRLGDITGGQVMASVVGPRSEKLADARSMRDGDTLEFALADGAYVLRLDRLVNVLIGDDHADFSLMSAQTFKAHEVEHLLEVIAASNLVFVRNGAELTSEEFATLLRKKRGRLDGTITVDEFIDKVASYSTSTGKPYMVRLSDGKTIEAATWLRKQVGGS